MDLRDIATWQGLNALQENASTNGGDASRVGVENGGKCELC